jgi:hypothetical protein
MREAWRYYCLDGLTRAARRHLALRGIDTFALELREGRPLARHTPRSKTGLVDHLRRRGFADNELVDAGRPAATSTGASRTSSPTVSSSPSGTTTAGWSA